MNNIYIIFIDQEYISKSCNYITDLKQYGIPAKETTR